MSAAGPFAGVDGAGAHRDSDRRRRPASPNARRARPPTLPRTTPAPHRWQPQHGERRRAVPAAGSGQSAALAPAVAASLRRGDIALVLSPVVGGVVAARDAGRAVCAALLSQLFDGHGIAPQISRSATPGLAALALTLSGAVGVDVERRRPELVDDDLLALALHADERPGDFFAVWTRKEAVMKALGVGIALAPGSFHAGPPTTDWHAVRTPSGRASVRNLQLLDDAGRLDGHAAAVATDAAAGETSAICIFEL